MITSWEMTLHNVDMLRNFLREYHNIDNQFYLLGTDKAFSGFMRGTQDDAFSQSVVAMNAPYRFRANKRDGYAIISNQGGELVLNKDGKGSTLSCGQVVCVSPEMPFDTTSSNNVNMVMTRLNSKSVSRVCSAWLGTPVDAPPELDLKPFSSRLRAQWDAVVNTINLLHQKGGYAETVVTSLEEYAISLLLNGHSHSYSNYLNKDKPANAKMVADAQAFIQERVGETLSPADIAEFFGCSLDALHKGFEECLGISVRECIYVSRIAKLRELNLERNSESYLRVLRTNGFMTIRRLDSNYQRIEANQGGEIADAVNVAPSKGRISSLDPQSTATIQAKVISTLSQPLKVAELAKLVGMSETTFRAAFKATFGSSPTQYILEQRLNWGKWLLAHTNKSIATIAAETGFASQAHFTTMLKQTQGITPGQLRKTHP